VSRGFIIAMNARATLDELCAGLLNPDANLQVLDDSLKVCASKAEHLLKTLHAGLIEQNQLWDSWRGRYDKGQPHQLTASKLSDLLAHPKADMESNAHQLNTPYFLNQAVIWFQASSAASLR
jgi:hypothetical protein